MATDLIKAGVETLYVSNVPQNVYSAWHNCNGLAIDSGLHTFIKRIF
jgi:hypothetical protein